MSRESELSSGLIVRRATVEDADALAPFAARTFADTFAADNTEADLEAYLAANFTIARLREELSDTSTRFLIAETAGTIAGYAKLHWGPAPDSVKGPRPVELSRIYVGADWLGQGVGQALLERCFVEARDTGFETMWLGVWERNVRAQGFYEKWGFRQAGTHVFMFGSDPQTDWIMVRDL